MTRTPARICLVTPGHLSTNPRLVKEADALIGAGYEVTVISARYLPWAENADREFDGRAWKRVKVTFGPLAARPVHVARRAVQEAARQVWSATGLLGARALHSVVPSLTTAARKVRADLYIAHNLAALPAAASAAQRHGGRLGFDAEDLHRGFWSEGVDCMDARLTRAVEEQYLPRCDYLTASSPGIAEAYEACCGIRRPAVILNVFDAHLTGHERPASRERKQLYWFSQTVGPGRGLEAAIRAIGISSSRPDFFIRGQTTDVYLRKLRRLARDCGVSDRLHVLPPAAPSSMVRLAAAHDIGLAAETSVTANHRLCLSNKIFTYVAAGMPVLASDTPAQRQLAAEAADAIEIYVQDDARSLAGQIDRLCMDANRLSHARSCAMALANGSWNWQRESEKFLTRVDDALRSSVHRVAVA